MQILLCVFQVPLVLQKGLKLRRSTPGRSYSLRTGEEGLGHSGSRGRGQVLNTYISCKIFS